MPTARQSLTRRIIATSALMTLALSGGAPARQVSGLCDAAARRASERTGVPLALLAAITRVETGRGKDGTLTPWPWAVNQGGESHWFETEADALRFVESALAEGKTNIDLGCFQLNHRWHGASFPSLEAMFDPEGNALQAARFLADLATESGDWRSAVSAYHSRTPEFADRYLARFDTVIAAMGSDTGSALGSGLPDGTPVVKAAERRVPLENHYPLLRAGARGSAGSLVPRLDAGQRLFGSGE